MILAVDTETDLFGPGRMAPPVVCVSLACDDGGAELLHHSEAHDALRTILQSDCTVVGQNFAYDAAVIAAEWPDLLPDIFAAYDADRIEDTKIRQKLIDIAEGCYRGFRRANGETVKLGYSLDDLSKRHLGLALDKTTWRTGYGTFRDVPLAHWPDGAREYALGDAAVTLLVHQAQEAKRGWLRDQHRQARAALWLHLTSCWGLTTEATAIAELEGTKRSEYDRLARELVAAGLKRPDRVLKAGARKGQVVEEARDTKAARARLSTAYLMSQRPIPQTEKGQVALDDDACRKSGDPALIAYADFGTVSKTLATDIPMLQAKGHYLIQARFDELLETGRTSSGKGVDGIGGNIQNLPRTPGVRECFIPRPGHVYAAADYAGLELRTWAQACIALVGGSRMAEVLNSNGDPHCMIAASILGCSYDEAVQRKKDPDGDNARQCGKVANFGFPGGLGPATFVHYAALSYGVELSEEKARELKALWLNTWPEAGRYLAYIDRLVNAPGMPRVEQLYSGRFRGGVSYCEGANTYFQGLGADAAKAAGWLVSKACYVDRDSPLYGSRIVNFVHDELIVEVPEEIAHECLEELEGLMIAGAAPWLPDVPPRVEGVLMRRWSKQAKRIVRDGRVVPWPE